MPRQTLWLSSTISLCKFYVAMFLAHPQAYFHRTFLPAVITNGRFWLYWLFDTTLGWFWPFCSSRPLARSHFFSITTMIFDFWGLVFVLRGFYAPWFWLSKTWCPQWFGGTRELFWAYRWDGCRIPWAFWGIGSFGFDRGGCFDVIVCYVHLRSWDRLCSSSHFYLRTRSVSLSFGEI